MVNTSAKTEMRAVQGKEAGWGGRRRLGCRSCTRGEGGVVVVREEWVKW